MKKLFLFAFLLVGMLGMNAQAQEAADENEITEEEMTKFASMEAAVSVYLAEKQATLEEMIKSDEVLGGAARYNELKRAWGNEEKLAEIEATEEEKNAFQAIQDYIDSLGKDVVEYKKELIMDNDVLGAATYNKVKKAMDSDPAVKEQIDNLIAEIKEGSSSEDQTVEEATSGDNL
ncbi:MAG: hypothetical protein ACXIT9_02565 [Nitritalea sp.]